MSAVHAIKATLPAEGDELSSDVTITFEYPYVLRDKADEQNVVDATRRLMLDLYGEEVVVTLLNKFGSEVWVD